MELFDKDYVNFLWEDELEGKSGFVSDNIDRLIEIVNSNKFSKDTVSKSDCASVPFYWGDCDWKFFYHDPNYEVKIAHIEGKKIQIYVGGEWIDVKDENPNWKCCYKFRIKPEERLIMTHKELAEWVSKQNGQYKISDRRTTYIYITHKYPENEENEELTDDFSIRSWGSSEWVKPTVDIYLRDCKKEKR